MTTAPCTVYPCELTQISVSPESCVARGEMLMELDAVYSEYRELRHDKAMKFFERACRAGDPKGCLYTAR